MDRRTWAAVLAAPFACCLFSCAPRAADPKPEDVALDPSRTADRHGERLPPGAVARLGRLNDARPGAGSRGLSFSPDGSLLAFVAQDGDTRIWDVKAETELHRFAHDPVHFPNNRDRRVFTTDGKLLIGDGGAVWVVATGKPADRFGPVPKGGDTPLAFPTPSPDGKTVLFVTFAGGPEVGEVVVFDLATRKELRRFGKGTRVDGPLVFSPDGKTLATPKNPAIVRVPKGGKKGERPEPPADGESGVMLWDPATGEKKAEWRSKSYGPWTPLGFSADARLLYVLADEKLVVWEVPSAKPERFVAAGKPAREPFGYWMRRAVLMPDRKTLAVAEPQGLALWSIPDEKQVGKVERPVAWTVDMVPSPSGRWLATGGNDGTILVWDVAALRAKP